MRTILLLSVLFFIGCTIDAKVISPYDYGLSEAKNGVDRYDVLLRTHSAAIEKNCGVSYAGIDTLTIEIPSGAPSILLSD